MCFIIYSQILPEWRVGFIWLWYMAKWLLWENVVSSYYNHAARAAFMGEVRLPAMAGLDREVPGTSSVAQGFTPPGSLIQHLSLQTDRFLMRERLRKSWKVKTDRKDSSSVPNQCGHWGQRFAFLQLESNPNQYVLMHNFVGQSCVFYSKAVF